MKGCPEEEKIDAAERQDRLLAYQNGFAGIWISEISQYALAYLLGELNRRLADRRERELNTGDNDYWELRGLRYPGS